MASYSGDLSQQSKHPERMKKDRSSQSIDLEMTGADDAKDPTRCQPGVRVQIGARSTGGISADYGSASNRFHSGDGYTCKWLGILYVRGVCPA